MITPAQMALSVIGTCVAFAGLLLAIASFRAEAWRRAQADQVRAFAVDGPESLATRITKLERRLNEGDARWSKKHGETTARIGTLELDVRELRRELEIRVEQSSDDHKRMQTDIRALQERVR